MSTPVCIANAAADALGVKNISLPLTPNKVWQLTTSNGLESHAPRGVPAMSTATPGLSSSGTIAIDATPEAVFDVINDPDKIAQVIPGCESLQVIGEHHYRADVTVGVGIVKARYRVEVKISEQNPPRSFVLSGKGISSIGVSEGTARVTLVPRDGGATLHYEYGADISGKVAAIGGRMLESAAKLVLKQLFEKLAQVARGEAPAPKRGWWQKLTGKESDER